MPVHLHCTALHCTALQYVDHWTISRHCTLGIKYCVGPAI